MAKRKKQDIDIDKFLKESEALLGKRRSFHVDKSKLLYGGVALAIVLVVIIGVTMYSPDLQKPMQTTGEEICDTRQCFLDRANEKLPTVYVNTIETLDIQHKIIDGMYEKTVLGVADSEPIEIQDLFLGASMTCPYAEGEFDPDYVDMISGNIVVCEGSLKEAILAVLL